MAELLAERRLADLASGRLRQLCANLESRWHLERREALGRPCPELLAIEVYAGFGSEHRDDLFAAELVGHADHGALEHAGVRIEDLLDLAWVDVLTAADDHVLG